MMVGQWLLQSESTLKKVIAGAGHEHSSVSGIVFLFTSLFRSPLAYHYCPLQASDAAEVVLIYLLNLIDNFPAPTGPSTISSHSHERDFIDSKMRKSKHLATFLFDQAVYVL
jgi:hypothetical protein